jgi:hypothetical protein
MAVNQNLPNPAQLLNEAPPRYRFTLGSLVAGLLPVLLRKPRMLAYLNALVAPVATLYVDFLAYEASTRLELSFNGQTLAFERALNVRFDPVFRRIRIINSDAQTESTYDNFIREGQPWQYMTFKREGPPWLYDYGFAELQNQVGFVVRVPQSLAPKEPAIIARVRQLKLAMIKFRIQYI